eukprot:XP_763818.1 hypothetical protein [Theileria parva strain Muguga]
MKFEKIIIIFFFSVCRIFSECTELFNILREITLKHYGNIADELQLQILETKIKDSIVKASEMLNLENFESSDCEPDFSSFCPQNWYYLGDGVHCKADSGYNGPCDRVMDFSDKTPLDKLRISNDCSVQWPCKLNKLTFIPKNILQCPKFWYTHEWDNNLLNTTNLSDFSENCSLGYTGSEYSGNEFCVPDDKYNTKFQGKLYFKDLQDKFSKTYQYNLTWNFKTRNEEYLDEKCPYKWKFDPNTSLCLSPPDYQGPCQIRVNFTKFDRKLKNIWANVCLVDFYPNEQIAPKPNAPTQKFYKDGAIEPELKIVKKSQINELNTPIDVLQRQLKELYKLRKLSHDDNFLSTLQYTIDKLEKKIIGPSFLQISSNIVKNKHNCPYNWDKYENICIAPKSYQFFVPNCFTIISRYNLKSNSTCRLQFDEMMDEDYVREPCPEGWKIERKLDGKILRTICRAKMGEIKHNFTQCGTKVDFTNISPNFKRIWAFTCNAKFPPRSPDTQLKCKENYFNFIVIKLVLLFTIYSLHFIKCWFRKCPYGWKEEAESCIAPNTYNGPCDKFVKLSQIATPELKKTFSQKCLAFWDCLDNCEKDYSQVCPKDWKWDNNKCIAAYKYDFPCKNEFKPPKVYVYYLET